MDRKAGIFNGQSGDSRDYGSICSYFYFSLFYVFALIARFDNTIFKSVKNAVMLAVFNLRETFLLTLIHVIVIVLMIFTKGIWIFMMVADFQSVHI